MLLTEFHHLINKAFPPTAAVQGDAIGLQVQSQQQTANRVLVALELTSDVLQEAIDQHCDVVLVFHPLIYRPLATINLSERVGELTAGLIRADIALIAVHTAFDAFPQGTNTILAKKLGLSVTQTLVPGEEEGFGMGLLCSLSQPMSSNEFATEVANTLGGPVRMSTHEATIQSVAIVAGSGMSYYNDALQSAADAFVTADVKYHDFHAAHEKMVLIDPGHYEMEQFVPEGIVDALSRSAATTTLITSTVRTNPVQYVSPLPIDHSIHHVGQP